MSWRPGGPLSVAVAVSRWMTSCAEMLGNFARINAAAPDTMAVACEVPQPFRYLLFPYAASMSTPGAHSCTYFADTEKPAGSPDRSEAPTASTPGIAAGYAETTS